jgi:N-acyl homoserine lactone hydrolase
LMRLKFLHLRTSNWKIYWNIPVPWFFIQHPKGNIVIDGGNAVECVRTSKDI